MPLSLISAPAVEPLTIAEAKRQVRLDDTDGEPAPPAPTLALASPAAPGLVDNGAHRLGVTFGTADGETEIGALSAPVTVTDKAVNGQLAASAIAIGGAAVTYRRLWLTPVAGGAAKLAATLSNNTATTATLNLADASLGAEAPTTNTTQDPRLTGLIVAVRDRAELGTNRALITQTWDYVLDGFPADGYIEIPRPPLVSVTYVKYVDMAGVLQTMTVNTDYVVQAPAGPRCLRGRIALPFASVWPVPLPQMGSVTIRFVCGYGASGSFVPAMLRQAMLLDLGTLHAASGDAVVGTIIAKLPVTADRVYWSFRSHPTQRVA